MLDPDDDVNTPWLDYSLMSYFLNSAYFILANTGEFHIDSLLSALEVIHSQSVPNMLFKASAGNNRRKIAISRITVAQRANLVVTSKPIKFMVNVALLVLQLGVCNFHKCDEALFYIVKKTK